MQFSLSDYDSKATTIIIKELVDSVMLKGQPTVYLL